MNRLGKLLCAAVLLQAAHGGQQLPVFLADNHAESFGWLLQHVDLDVSCDLVLVDAHSDASAAERSEDLRDRFRRVSSAEERAGLVEEWRKSGRIQAYNWLEPLMPLPIGQVCWVVPPALGLGARERMHREALDALDGRMEVEPRSAGSLADRWVTIDLDRLEGWQPGLRPVVLSVDLDFFAGMVDEERVRTWNRIWHAAMGWPGLQAVTFSVSRLWLASDDEADALVEMVCHSVNHTRGSLLMVDASVDDRPDDSLRSRESGHLPRWDAASASPALQALWLQMEDRLVLKDRQRDWKGRMDRWGREIPNMPIRPDTGEMDCDGVWRFRVGEAPVLRIAAPTSSTGRVRWFRLESERLCYDLLPESRLGKIFSKGPGRWVSEKRMFLSETRDFALSPERYHAGQAGRLRIVAEVETDRGWIPTGVTELRFHEKSGFRGALSECFGMPYVFGVAMVAGDGAMAVDCGWGADCSNLLVHAWRRNGLRLSWGSPVQLRAQLTEKVSAVSVGDLGSGISISEQEVERGLLVDFGSHVAAIWEDREPRGQLTAEDLVVHQLGGLPEIVPLQILASDRPSFSLRVPTIARESCTIAIAGDVVLAGEPLDVVDGFDTAQSNLTIANLEGIPSMLEPVVSSHYDFRFPAMRLSRLRELGVDVVSLANNHAGDAGRDGLIEGVRRLQEAGIGVVGAGGNDLEACRPRRESANGVELSVFGVCLVECLSATKTSPGVAFLPDHAAMLGVAIKKELDEGRRVIVLTHGGDEYCVRVTDDQRRWTRWLVEQGTTVVAGSHPHVLQRTEHHGGALIGYSLGNAVYPRSLGKSGSGAVWWLRLSKHEVSTVFPIKPSGLVFPWWDSESVVPDVHIRWRTRESESGR